jgi:predicted nucleic acid-binding protein
MATLTLKNIPDSLYNQISEFRNVLALYLRKNILTFDEILMIIQQAESLMLEN